MSYFIMQSSAKLTAKFSGRNCGRTLTKVRFFFFLKATFAEKLR